MRNNRVVKGGIAAGILFVTLEVQAAGFGLIEQSASMGNGFAGGAAVAEDASTIYFNPAGMTYLPENQLVVGLHATKPSANFSNDGSTKANGSPATGGDGGDGGGWAFIPNIYYAKAISPSISLGIGVSSLFGLKTDYDKGWAGRYQAIKSDLKTININPSIAFKASDRVSFGLGISAMRSKAELTNAIDFGALVPSSGDGLATVKGDDWGWGWNAGAMFQLTEATRLGVAYRSAVHQTLDGTVSFKNVPAPLSGLSSFQRGGIEAKLVTPENVSVALLHHVDQQWDVMADIVWTRWSRFKDLTVTRDTGATVVSVPENWNNATRVAVGTSYQYNALTKWRLGVAYDESPIPDAYRTPRVPDSDRIWLSLGLGYQVSPQGTVDVSYTHIFFKDSNQNKVNDTTVPALQDNLKGHYDNYADILSAQYTYNF